MEIESFGVQVNVRVGVGERVRFGETPTVE